MDLVDLWSDLEGLFLLAMMFRSGISISKGSIQYLLVPDAGY